MKTKILRVISFEDSAGYTCEHCGTGLRYVVTVELDGGKVMRVGRDCAQKDFITTSATRRMLRKTPAKYRADRIRELESTIKSLRASVKEYDDMLSEFGPDYVMLDHEQNKRQIEYIARWEKELNNIK